MLLDADEQRPALEALAPPVRQSWWRPSPARCLALLSLVYAAIYLYAGRHNTFYSDEWAFIIKRQGWDLNTLLEPNNEHMSLAPLLVYKLLLPITGLKHYWVFRSLVIALHIVCSWLIFAYARKRLDQWLALGLAVLLLAFGSGWEDIMWPFQIAWLLSIGSGVGAFITLERRTRRGDLATAALVTLSLASSGIGLAFAIGVSAEILWTRAFRKRIWVTAIPLVLIGIWTIAERPLDHTSTSLTGLIKAPSWAVNLASTGVGGFVGQSADFGRPLLIALLIGLVWTLGRRGRFNPRSVGFLVTAFAFLAMTAIARAATTSPPNESRYVYLISVLVLLIAAEAARSARKPAPWVVATAWLLVGLSAATNLSPLLIKGVPLMQKNAFLLKADLTAIELARDHVGSNFIADKAVSAFTLAGPYLEAVSKYGSPAFSIREIPLISERARRRIDDTSAVALRASPRPIKDAPAGQCLTIRGAATRKLPKAGLVVTTSTKPAELRLRRFADGWEPGPATPGRISQPASAKPFLIKPHSRVVMTIPTDRSTITWWARISSNAEVKACSRLS